MKPSHSSKVVVVSFLFLSLIFVSQVAVGQHLTTLYTFQGYSAQDGQNPYGGLMRNSSGNLFGTTEYGGTGCVSTISGCGTVFELAPYSGGYTYTLLHEFAGGTSDGSHPYAGNLISDGAGDLYGTTTSAGGSNDGTIFELVNSTSCTNDFCEHLLYSFGGPTADGAGPNGSLISSSGNLYGTTVSGGANSSYGAVFELPSGSGSDTVLYSFAGGTSDGATPNGSLIADSSGNLYGTTQSGGASSGGSVFELVNNGGGSYSEKLLYSFTGSSGDGKGPTAGLIVDSSGNLYGTTAFGGGNANAGIVFELSPVNDVCPLGTQQGNGYCETILYTFAGGTGDGSVPYGGLVIDSSNNLYGTTFQGGTNNSGTIFELANSSGTYTERILYSFTGGSDGAFPYAGLVSDGSGNFFGTTTAGGAASGSAGYGTVFELSPGCPNFPTYSPDFTQNENCLSLQGSNTGYPSFQAPAPPPASGVPPDVSTVLRLTPNQTFWAGSAWYKTAQLVGGNWSTTFSFQLSDTNAVPDGNADGIAFLVQNSALNALGNDGCAMGYAEDTSGSCALATGGIPNSLAVAFKTYNDGYPNPNNNSVLITSGGTGPNCIDQSCSIAFNNTLSSLGITLANNGVHTATITYALQPTATQTACAPDNVPGPCLDVILDGTDLFPQGVPFNISSSLNLTDGNAFVGFTGGTGGGDDDQDILDWLFNVGQTQVGTVTPTQPANFNFYGGFTEGSSTSGYNWSVTETTTQLTLEMQVTPIPMEQGACNSLVRANPAFGTAECLVYLNGGGPGVDSAVMFSVTCPPAGSCGSEQTQSFEANLASELNFNCLENLSLVCPTFDTNGNELTPGDFGLPNITSPGNPYPELGVLKGTGTDPNNPCDPNDALYFQSNQVISASVGDSSLKPIQSGSGGGTSCWVVTYMTENSEIPSVSISQPVSNYTYQLGEQDSSTLANYSCTAVNAGANSPTGPYLTVSSCTATDNPGGPVANGAQFDTSTPGEHTFTAYVQDSAYNTSQTQVTYNVVGPQTIGGTISGLSGTGLVLLDNGGNNLLVPANATAFTFSTPIAYESRYNVTVGAQPSSPSQTCVVTNGAGAVGSTPVTSVVVNCTTNSYVLTTAVSPSGGGTVSPASGGSYLWGTSVPLVATPAAGYVFSSWTASPLAVGNANNASTSVTMTAPESVTANFVSALTVSPSAINFGTVYLGSITTQNVTLTNTGTTPITVSEPFISLVKGQNSAFVIISVCPKSLAAGSHCTIVVAFVAGPYYSPQSANLTIMDNAPGNPQIVPMTATVIDPQASLKPSSLNFGTIKHGTTSTINVTLSNPGATPLTINGMSLTGTNKGDFTLTPPSTCTSPLAAGGNCTISVTFAPPTAGTFSATLTVSDNSITGSTQSVPLSGKGN